MRSLLPRRRAFTLLELLVACVVLGTGVLGLASTAVAIARLAGDATREENAAERGQARMEALRASRCSASTSGSVVAGGISEWWSAAGAPAGQLLADSIRYSQGAQHVLHTELLLTAVGCP